MASPAKSRLTISSPDLSGELAQLVERCDRTAEATGSSPVFSIVIIQGCCLGNLKGEGVEDSGAEIGGGVSTIKLN